MHDSLQDPSTLCRHVLLARSPGVRIVLCTVHHLVELDMGGVTMRLEAEAFARMANCMQLAFTHLQGLNTHHKAFAQFMQQLNAR